MRERLEHRLLILAPSGRDASLAAAAMQPEGVPTTICPNAEILCTEIEAGAGAVLVTQEALAGDARTCIVELLRRQPVWSELPVVILATRPPTASGRQRLASALAELGNINVLDRPMHAEAMVSAVRSALRARARQYQARELLSRLEEGVRERDHFLATLGHELRNPIGAIRNAMQLLERGTSVDPNARRPLAVLDRQTRHLGKLVDDLLDVSRVTTGKIVLQRKVVDLRAILQNTLQQIEPAMDAHGVTLHSSLPAEPLYVNGDPVRLEQVFANLLNNAMKYTPREGRVTLTADRKDGDVRVRISDTGVGISGEMLPSIFKMFAQADQSLDRAEGGMGIGLTLVRSLLDLHQGSVTASSAGTGQGAEFVVTLPFDQSMSADRDADIEKKTSEPAGRHILLVEDNPDNRESLKELLELEGHQVDVAGDGSEGIRTALSRRPQVAIVDIGLPGIDGFEVGRRLRESFGADIFLIALTGYGQPEDRRKSAAAGFNAHVTKPADLPELEALLSGVDPTAEHRKSASG